MSEYNRLIRHSGNQNLFQIIEFDFWARIKTNLIGLLPAKGTILANTDNLGNSRGLQIIDPLRTKIIAPPKPAIPINRLPDEQLVTKSSKPHA